ncbi:restriction endonuclease [Chloroflexota bacterium]
MSPDGIITLDGAPSEIRNGAVRYRKTLLGTAPYAFRERYGGVDGLLSIVKGKDKSTKVIAQVKGSKALNPSMVRDLIGTVEKERAAIGLLITLEESTPGIKGPATLAGSCILPVWNKSYPHIQIHTIDDLLEGKGFDLPYRESPIKKAEAIKEQVRSQRMPIGIRSFTIGAKSLLKSSPGEVAFVKLYRVFIVSRKIIPKGVDKTTNIL